MKVQFNYTQEDLVDSTRRFTERSRVARSWYWQNLIGTAIFSGLVFFVVFYRMSLVGLVAGTVVAVFGALYYAGTYQGRFEARMRRFFREKLGDENDFACEVELLPSAIMVREKTTQTTYEWKKVQEILVTDDSVDIFTRSGGVIVRNRAFKSPDEQKQFVALAQSYVAAAKQAESSTK
ncbi:MAG TPA: YcxB family protein [Pyrinomonadaceae bacterium]|nr:YcxB family protein [Pyrinomonadaceae bacterium]